MVTLFRLSQRRLPAVIAILAILLLFIAPEISKTLEHRRATGNSDITQSEHQRMPGMVMAGMDHSTMDHSAMQLMTAAHSALPDSHSPHHAHTSAMPSGMSMMDDIACGYCLFMLHFPLLLWVFVALFLLMLLSSRAPPRQSIIHFPHTHVTGLCQPRAPPAC